MKKNDLVKGNYVAPRAECVELFNNNIILAGSLPEQENTKEYSNGKFDGDTDPSDIYIP